MNCVRCFWRRFLFLHPLVPFLFMPLLVCPYLHLFSFVPSFVRSPLFGRLYAFVSLPSSLFPRLSSLISPRSSLLAHLSSSVYLRSFLFVRFSS